MQRLNLKKKRRFKCLTTSSSTTQFSLLGKITSNQLPICWFLSWVTTNKSGLETEQKFCGQLDVHLFSVGTVEGTLIFFLFFWSSTEKQLAEGAIHDLCTFMEILLPVKMSLGQDCDSIAPLAI